jgi:peptidoglycan-associated lipoprotein
MTAPKFLVAFAAAAMLSACASDPETAATTGTGDANAGVIRPGSQEDLRANIGDRVFFGTDRSNIQADQRPVLERQARWLSQYAQNQVTVEGHADERGTREYNFALGARRAETAKNFLIAKGITASRMRTISYGKERPVAVCDDISCWSQNRRAVTVLGGGNS